MGSLFVCREVFSFDLGWGGGNACATVTIDELEKNR